MGQQQASAKWNGNLKEGNGTMSIPKGNYNGPYTFALRFETGEGTNPEELVGAAQAGCFSMFLAAQITESGFQPNNVDTKATVTLDKDDTGPKITEIQLNCNADVPGLSEEKFQELVQVSKTNCPISRLYAGTSISVTAKLSTAVS